MSSPRSTQSHASITTGSRTAQAPMLRGVELIGRIDGPLIDMTVVQTYRNETDTDVEVVYTFPLPARAVLTGLDFELNGTRYSGTVRARAQAAERYEEALADGDTPILVERARSGMFTANLGNLKRGDAAVIRLRYAQMAQASGDHWRIAVPTVIAPLYGDATGGGGLAPHQAPITSAQASYPLAFDFCFVNAAALDSVSCSSHAIAIAAEADGMHVRSRNGALLDRDIVLLARRESPAWAALIADRGQAGTTRGIGIATVVLPQGVANDAPPLSVRIVLDCSGSMQGESIDWASVACQRLIGKLDEADEFSVTRFGSEFRHMRPRLGPATQRRREQTIEWLVGVQADLGGTEMQSALKAAGALQGKREHSDIVLITDGDIWAADDLVRWARSSGRRVFVIGVGASPNDAFLQELAEATGASCEIVTPGEDLIHAVDRIVARLQTPDLGQLQVQWPVPAIWSLQWPVRPAPGDSVMMMAGFGAAPASDSNVAVVSPRGAVSGPLGLRSDEDGVIAKLVAHERIRSGHFDDPAAAAERHQLVTEWTSLIAVAVRDAKDKADRLPKLTPVAHMVPAGWGGTVAAQDRSVVHFSLSAHTAAFHPSSVAFARDRSRPYSHLMMDDDSPALARRSKGPRGLQQAVRLHRNVFERVLAQTHRRRLSRQYGNACAPISLDLLRRAGLRTTLADALAAEAALGAPEALLVELLLDAMATLLAHEWDKDELEAVWNSRWMVADPVTRTERERIKALLDKHLLALRDAPAPGAPPDDTDDDRCEIPAYLRRMAG